MVEDCAAGFPAFGHAQRCVFAGIRIPKAHETITASDRQNRKERVPGRPSHDDRVFKHAQHDARLRDHDMHRAVSMGRDGQPVPGRIEGGKIRRDVVRDRAK